jgi:23S rRNA pseudouridine955/2504/2580 synthase/23S rRNA pseudouridine1911/1915/1917 synthase
MNIGNYIIAENENIVVIDKPSGLYSIPDRKQLEQNVKDLLIARYGNIFTVHRLDAPTSGVIVFAKNEIAHKHLSEQFENRSTQKTYIGIVHGIPFKTADTINAPIAEHPAKNGTMVVNRNGKEAITEYELMENLKRYSVLKFNILTGRTHQIRVHCKNIGHAIVCDEIYGEAQPILLSSFKKKFNLSKTELEEKPLLNRLALHAHRLTIDVLGTTMTFESPLPKDMAVAIKQMQRYM